MDEFRSTLQVTAAHYDRSYNNRKRWTSYWYQIDRALHLAENGTILEVGVGSGLVAGYLKQVMSDQVKTLDIAEDLKPDIVADVQQMPIPDQSVDCVICCEVLEHMPYDNATACLRELRRVARTAVLSVPNARRYSFRAQVVMGSKVIQLASLDLNRFFPKPKALPDGGEHYWEIGRPGYPLERFEKSIIDADWTIRESFRNPDFPYHHFFILD